MQQINKIMLALPNDRWFNNRHWHTFPYTLGILNSVLKDYDVNILDASFENLNYEETKKRISNYNPDIFGLSCSSMELSKHYQKMTSLLKEVSPNTKIVVGGIYPTLLPETIMKDKNIDYVVIGEGEYRFPKLIKYLSEEKPIDKLDGLAFRLGQDIKINKIENYIQDLDSIPFPDYSNLNFKSYSNTANKYAYFISPRRFPYANTITSRGCPFNCIFCSSKAINGSKIRYRSAESILKEIDFMVNKYGIKEVIFLDDNFFLDRKRLEKTLDGLIKRDYDLEWKTSNVAVYALDEKILEPIRESGCYQLIFAIESGSIKGLKRLNKPLSILKKIKPIVKKAKQLDFEIGGLYILGTPGETWEEIRNTIRLAEELDLDCNSFNIATPLPKTKLYEIVKEQKLIPEDFNFNGLDFKGFGKASITTDEFTPIELQVLRAYEWDRINFNTPEKIKKIARMNGLTLEEVNDWRINTRRECFNI